MSITCIYSDMDGFLVNFVGGALQAFGVDPKYSCEVATWGGIPAVISKHRGEEVTDPMLWDKLTDLGVDFWSCLEWLPWGRDIYALCRDIAPVVLMSTPTRDPFSLAGKVQWIQTNMPHDQRRRYALTPCKHHMAHPGAMLLDDGDHNIDKFRAEGGQAFCFPAPWNRQGFWPTVEQAVRMTKEALDFAQAQD